MMVQEVWLDDLKLHDVSDYLNPLAIREANFGSGPEPRVSSEGRPSGHGSINRTRYWGPRIVELVGYASGPTVAETAGVLASLRSKLSLPDAHSLRFTPFGGPDELELQVVQASALEAPASGFMPFLRWSVTLEAPDPRMYGPDVLEDSYEPFAGGSLGVTYDGTTPAPVLLTLSGGPGTPTAILNNTIGEQVGLAGITMTGADTLEIDTGARIVTLNGLPAPELIDAATNNWWEIVPGPNDLNVDGTFGAGGMILTVAWREAFL